VTSELALQRDQRVAALSSALQSRLAWDRILRQISAVLPGDVWLTALSSQQSSPPPAPTPSTTTSTTTTTTTTATPAAPVPPPTAGLLNITGYTYSQEGVARLLSRLAVVPALEDVQLVSSTQALVSTRPVVSFSIKAAVRTGETG
jgi:Tfp pilus assembly protein PilN